MHALTEIALTLRQGLLARLADRDRDERGDVPGWVMVTVMTAMLVAGLSSFVGPELQSMLSAALRSVTK